MDHPKTSQDLIIKPCSKSIRRRQKTRLVKATRVSAVELAKAVSKPMLVIPQPVLQIHECLKDVRMAQVESNSYIALGIKEEPVDAEEFEETTSALEEFNFDSLGYTTPLSTTIDEAVTTNTVGVTTRQKSSRKKDSLPLIEMEKQISEDANNNKKSKNTWRKNKSKESPAKILSPSVSPLDSILKKTIENSTSSSEDKNSELVENNNNLDIINNHTNSKEATPQPPVDGDIITNLEGKSSGTDIAEVTSMPETSGTENCGAVNPSQWDFNESAAEVESEIETNFEKRRLRSRKSITNSTEKACISTPPTSDEESEKEKPNIDDEQMPSSDTISSNESDEDIFPKMWILKEEERRTLVCSVCQKKFSRASILTAHKKKHFDPNVYKCSHCDKTFSSESSYKHHIAYSGLAPFKCDQCHKSYYTELKCNAHKEQCKGKNTERKYHCEECGRSYVMLCSLRTHIRERHSDFQPVKNLCCEQCGKRFRHRKYLELHMYSHSSEKNFECDVCHRKYKSSDILRHHVRMAHTDSPKVTCQLCSKEVSRVSLKAHMNRHREKKEEEEESARNLLNLAASSDSPCCRVCNNFFENEKLLEMHCCNGIDDSFTCPRCSEAFPTADDLVQHSCDSFDNAKSRNSSKIYKCIFCCREYNCHTPWLYHVRHHTGDKPYPCSECDKSFRLKQGLKVHMRNHTGEKPFKCHVCPAAFKQKPFLLDHINTHTGDKPYQCEQCLARFSVRSALSTHKRIHRREFLKAQR